MAPLAVGELTGSETAIVCQLCDDAMQQCILAGNLPNYYCVEGKRMRFPGEFMPNSQPPILNPFNTSSTTSTTGTNVRAGASSNSASRPRSELQHQGKETQRKRLRTNETNETQGTANSKRHGNSDTNLQFEIMSRFGRQRQPTSRFINDT